MSDDLIRDNLNQIHERLERMEKKMDALPQAQLCAAHQNLLDKLEKRIDAHETALTAHAAEIGRIRTIKRTLVGVASAIGAAIMLVIDKILGAILK